MAAPGPALASKRDPAWLRPSLAASGSLSLFDRLGSHSQLAMIEQSRAELSGLQCNMCSANLFESTARGESAQLAVCAIFGFQLGCLRKARQGGLPDGGLCVKVSNFERFTATHFQSCPLRLLERKLQDRCGYQRLSCPSCVASFLHLRCPACVP